MYKRQEAGAVGGQGQGQSGLVQSLVDEAADHGVLAGTDQVQVLSLIHILRTKMLMM